MLKILFNIFIVYAIWQLFKLFFVVNKTQKTFNERINDLDGKVNKNGSKDNHRTDKNQEGEYIDYEEIE